MISSGGFSLIELLVVLTILGIISAVSVSTYKSYLVSHKFTALQSMLGPYIDKSIAYANVHGHFGDPYQIGLIQAPMGQYGVSPTDSAALFPGFNPFWYYGFNMRDYDSTNSYSGCARRARVQMGFDGADVADLGLDPNKIKTVQIYVDYWTDKSNSVHVSEYYYALYNHSNQLQSSYEINGWKNVGPGFAAYSAMSVNMDNNAECM